MSHLGMPSTWKKGTKKKRGKCVTVEGIYSLRKKRDLRGKNNYYP